MSARAEFPLIATLLRWALLASLAATLFVVLGLTGRPQPAIEAATSTAALVYVALSWVWCWWTDAVPIRGWLFWLGAAALAGIAWLQLQPMPPDELAQLSPKSAELHDRLEPLFAEPLRFSDRANTAELSRRFAEDAEADGGAVPEPIRCLNLSPGAGRDELARLIIGLLFLIAVCVGPSDRSHLRATLILLAGLGTVVAYLTLVKRFIGEDALFWVDRSEELRSALGQQGNRNRVAGLINVGLGAAAGLLLEIVIRGRSSQTLSERGLSGLLDVRAWLGIRSGGIGLSDRTPRANVGSTSSSGSDPDDDRPPRDRLVALVPMVAGMAGAVVLSLSRGAALAAAAAATVMVVGLLISPNTRRSAGWPLAALLAAGALVGWLGWSAVEARLATLTDLEQLRAGRLQLWSDTIAMGSDFPLLGTGWGSFRTVYPMYRTIEYHYPVVFTHTENEYLQVWVETGWVGTAALAVMLAALAAAMIRCGRTALAGDGLAAGPMLAAITVLVGSAADFGFHGPANMFLYVLVLGLCLRQGSAARAAAHASEEREPLPSEPRGGPTRPLALPGFAALLLLVGTAVLAAPALQRQLTLGEAEMRLLVLELESGGRRRAPSEEAESRQTLSQLRPADAVLQQRLGDRLSAAVADEFGPHRARSDGPLFRAAERHHRRALAACPVYGPALTDLGRLYFLVRDPRAEPLLEAACRADPTNPEPQLYLARAHVWRGRFDEAWGALLRAADLQPDPYARYVEDALPALLSTPPGVVNWDRPIARPELRASVIAYLERRGRKPIADRIRRASAGVPDKRSDSTRSDSTAAGSSSDSTARGTLGAEPR